MNAFEKLKDADAKRRAAVAELREARNAFQEKDAVKASAEKALEEARILFEVDHKIERRKKNRMKKLLVILALLCVAACGPYSGVVTKKRVVEAHTRTIYHTHRVGKVFFTVPTVLMIPETYYVTLDDDDEHAVSKDVFDACKEGERTVIK